MRKIANGSAVKVTIPSDLAAAQEVQKRILREVERLNYSGQDAFAIKLSLEESLINAVKHGNKFDPTKTIYVEWNIDARQCEIIIEDQGDGFERNTVPDPTCEENLEKCSGRGILLIEAYMDVVEWSNNGRRVRMIKKNSANPS